MHEEVDDAWRPLGAADPWSWTPTLQTGTATTEFTGTSAVFDLMDRYNLTMDQALEVSDHMPVWAEFSIYEGGVPGHLARVPQSGPVGVPR